MNEEFYSIGRGSLNINGKFYYGLDYQITDFMRSLEEENKQLKEQYCERTDCSGRLGNSKKVEELEQENQQLKENNLAMQEEMARTWAKLEQKEDVIKQLLTYLDKNKLTLNNPNILDFYINVKKILNIEKSDNE